MGALGFLTLNNYYSTVWLTARTLCGLGVTHFKGCEQSAIFTIFVQVLALQSLLQALQLYDVGIGEFEQLGNNTSSTVLPWSELDWDN